MKFTVLIENTASADCFAFEHGLSLYIETAGHTILFDSGATGAFADNAEKLGLDLAAVDIAVLSHGHYDHGGGLLRFLELNKTAKIYANKNVFGNYIGRTGNYIGLDPQLRASDRFVLLDGGLKLDDELEILSGNGRELKYPIDASGLGVERAGRRLSEEFSHEQYLKINESGKSILISGCSHKGIQNIMSWFSPDVLIGGFHFMNIELDEPGRARLDAAAEELLSYNTMYYSGHCTGLPQYEYLKSIMGDRLDYISAGRSFEV